jgi:hypothetical protein
MTPSDNDGLEGSSDGSPEFERARQLSELKQFLEESRRFRERVLAEKYGAEILTLSVDDARLLAAVKGADPSLQRMALCSLVHLRYVYDARIVEKCADYMEFGALADIRGLCVGYLCSVLVYEADDRRARALQSCARRLREPHMTSDDASVANQIDVVIQEFLEVKGLREKRDTLR